VTRYVAAVLLGVAAIAPLVCGALRLRRRFAPELRGSAGAIAVVVVVVSAIVAAAEGLGTVGQFRRIAMCVVLAGAGAVACALGARIAPHATELAPTDARQGIRRPNTMNIVAVAVVALVAASWLVRTVASMRHGMETIDTLWYHMPTAARFVQTGSTTSLHYVDSDPVTVFYPASSPLLHAFALQLFSNDFLSPLLNLGWLALALTAAWSIGVPYDVAPITLAGGAIIVATPGYVSTQPGGAYTDIVGLALFLAAVALLLHRRKDARGYMTITVVAALAAGLALGTKFTFLAPVGALTITVVLLSVFDRVEVRTRWRAVAAWCVPLLLIGGYFYVRNLAAVGNPLPSTSLGLHLPTPPVPTPTFTVGQYLFDGTIWRKFYVPGLWAAIGPAWWAILAVVLVGCSAAAFARVSPLQRGLAAVVIVTVVAYVLTPQFLGFVHRPVYFVFNVRYVSPALALGLCLLPTLSVLARARIAPWVLGAYVAILIGTQFGPTIWSWSAAGLSRSQFHERIATSDVTLGIVGALLVAIAASAWAARGSIPWNPGFPRPASVVIAAIALIAITGLGYPLQQYYLHRRYVSSPPMPTIYRWARSQHDQRIALIGMDLQYPLYGRDDSNYVQYVGKRGPHGAYTPYTSCVAWRNAIDKGRYDYVVVTPTGFGLVAKTSVPRELEWTQHDPHSSVVLRDGPPGASAVLLHLSGRLDPKGCGST
jgi:hypothetical protein